MSDKVKLIIEIPKPMYESVQNGTYCGTLYEELKNGTPLDSNSERAEVQAYFDGEAYGWECGRNALIDDIAAEIKRMEYHMIDCDVLVSQEEVLDIIEKYREPKGEKGTGCTSTHNVLKR
jgi:hypothetical protein